jgi:quaternary ammonium compound-resistance protein SugE
MAWIILIASGFLEAVWATALGQSQGFTRPGPTITFLVTNIVSMVGLAFAMKTLPTGTAYAVWVAIGATLTVAWAMLTGTEPASLVKVMLLLTIIACVIGLKVLN